MSDSGMSGFGVDRRTFLTHGATGLAAVALSPDLAALLPPRPAGKQVGIGLVGFGRQGRKILRELAKIEGCRVAAVCDTDGRRLKRAGQIAGDGAESFADAAAMLADAKGVDAVVIATPTHKHLEVTLAAIEAGRAVYIETPLENTTERAGALAQAAASAGAPVAAGATARTNPVYKLARSFRRSGAIEDVVSVRAQWMDKTSWRTAAGDPVRDKALNWKLDQDVSLGLPGEMGCHAFDLLHWFCGIQPTAVTGGSAVVFHHDGRKVADTAHLSLSLPRGAHMTWEASLANSYDGELAVIRGTGGTFRLAETHAWLFKEADSPTQGWEVYAHREMVGKEQGIVLIADATKLAARSKLEEGIGLPHPPLYYALHAFVTAVAEGGEPGCTVVDALPATSVSVWAAHAARSGERIPLGPGPEGPK